MDRDGAAHDEVARPQGARHPDGPRLRRLLYVPAAKSSGSLNATYEGARELAAWKQKVRAAWPRSGSTTWRAQGLGDIPQLGTTVGIRAFAALGDLAPDGHRGRGRARPRRHQRRDHRPARARCRWRTTTKATVPLRGRTEAGPPRPFGYTVRVIPQPHRPRHRGRNGPGRRSSDPTTCPPRTSPCRLRILNPFATTHYHPACLTKAGSFVCRRARPPTLGFRAWSSCNSPMAASWSS